MGLPGAITKEATSTRCVCHLLEWPVAVVAGEANSGSLSGVQRVVVCCQLSVNATRWLNHDLGLPVFDVQGCSAVCDVLGAAATAAGWRPWPTGPGDGHPVKV